MGYDGWMDEWMVDGWMDGGSVADQHLRAHEPPEHLVCRLLLEKKQ